MQPSAARSLSLAFALLALALSPAAQAAKVVKHPVKHGKVAPKEVEHPVVAMKTSLGTITLELDAVKAPLSTANFLRYVSEKFYDGTVFHRVISSFMIQGGGFTRDLAEKPTHAPIKNESQNGLKNVRGTIAMARTNVPDSATSQFFINVKDNPNLDYPSFDGHGYAVFGQVTRGMDVVDKIRAVKTGSKNGMQDVPAEPVVIESVRRLK